MPKLAPSPKQLLLDIERIHRKKKEPSQKPNESRQLQIDLLEKIESYHVATGEPYRPVVDINISEKIQISNIFRDFRGFSWNNNFGWIGQAKTVTKLEIKILEGEAPLFDGITCSSVSQTGESNAVYGIDFRGNGCIGQFSQSICNLEQCQSLLLDFNLISGELPTSLKKLANIEYISFSGNMIEGQLKDESISSLIKLRQLDLSFNTLSGNIPNSFQNLTKLLDLNLSGNKFTGILPNSISNLTNLKTLKLYNNDLYGPLPLWLKELIQLTEVNLSCNRFSGTIHSFYSCIRLKKLILNNNQIEGNILSNISNINNLEILYLHSNLMTGSIPPELGSLKQLHFINLSDNNFSGILPNQIINLKDLEIFILSRNNFIGPLPADLTTLTNLRDFHIFTPYPADSLQLPRVFNKMYFHRICGWGPLIGMDNICWSIGDDDKNCSNDLSSCSEKTDSSAMICALRKNYF
eukprot:gene12046-25242_t